jgi:chromosomal replication initiation ATPase DnaA
MIQLPLGIVPRRAYSARNFVAHAGVSAAIEQIRAFLVQPIFRIMTVTGSEKSGLSHLSISLAQSLADTGLFPRLIEGADFFDWANERTSQTNFDAGEVALVDDADLYLKNIAANDSGHFVNIIECLRRQRGAIVFFMHQPFVECGCDDHVLSRLRAGQQVVIGAPGEEDLQKLISQMASQRGINISRKNIDFLAKRLPRDIARIDEYLERLQQLAEVSGQTYKLSVLSDAISSLKPRPQAN